MKNLPRKKLCDLVVKYGRDFCDNPQRCEGLLRDFCSGHPQEMYVLISALKEHVPTEVLASGKSVPHEALLARLTKRLEDNFVLAEQASRWAVESWALALGVISQEECDALEEKKREQLVEQVLKPFIEVALADKIMSPEEKRKIIEHGICYSLTEDEVEHYIHSMGIDVERKPPLPPDPDVILKQIRSLMIASEVMVIGFAGVATLILFQVPLEKLDSVLPLSSMVISGIFLIMPTLAFGTSNLMRENRFLRAGLGFTVTVGVAYAANNLALGNSLILFFFVSAALLVVTALTGRLLTSHLRRQLSKASGWVDRHIPMITLLIPASVLLLFLIGAYALSVSGISFGFQTQHLLALISEEIKLGLITINDGLRFLEQYITMNAIPIVHELAAQGSVILLWLIVSWTFFLSLVVVAILEVMGLKTGSLRFAINRIFAVSLLLKVVEFTIGWIVLSNPAPILVTIIGIPPKDTQAVITQHQYFLAALALLIYWRFFKKFKFSVVVLTVLLGLPVLAGQVHFPADLTAESLSKFLGFFISYWRELIEAIWNVLRSGS